MTPRFLCELEGLGGGPVILEIGQDEVTATRGAGDAEAPTITLPVETFIRLVWGRLDAARARDRGVVQTQVPRDEILALCALFPGH
jgi:hypothetical protein